MSKEKFITNDFKEIKGLIEKKEDQEQKEKMSHVKQELGTEKEEVKNNSEIPVNKRTEIVDGLSTEEQALEEKYAEIEDSFSYRGRTEDTVKNRTKEINFLMSSGKLESSLKSTYNQKMTQEEIDAGKEKAKKNIADGALEEKLNKRRGTGFAEMEKRAKEAINNDKNSQKISPMDHWIKEHSTIENSKDSLDDVAKNLEENADPNPENTYNQKITQEEIDAAKEKAKKNIIAMAAEKKLHEIEGTGIGVMEKRAKEAIDQNKNKDFEKDLEGAVDNEQKKADAKEQNNGVSQADIDKAALKLKRAEDDLKYKLSDKNIGTFTPEDHSLLKAKIAGLKATYESLKSTNLPKIEGKEDKSLQEILGERINTHKSKIAALRSCLNDKTISAEKKQEIKEAILIKERSIERLESRTDKLANANFEESIRHKSIFGRMYERAKRKGSKLYNSYLNDPYTRKRIIKRMRRSALIAGGVALFIGTGGAAAVGAAATFGVARSLGGFAGSEVAANLYKKKKSNYQDAMIRLREKYGKDVYGNKRKLTEADKKAYAKERDALLANRGSFLRKQNWKKMGAMTLGGFAGGMSVASAHESIATGSLTVDPFRRFGERLWSLTKIETYENAWDSLNNLYNQFGADGSAYNAEASFSGDALGVGQEEVSGTTGTEYGPQDQASTEVSSRSIFEQFKPEEYKPPQSAFIGKGEGITHAYLRQLQESAELRKALGITGDPTGADAAKLAMKHGYIQEGKPDVWVKHGFGAAYDLEIIDGKVEVIESVNGDPCACSSARIVETHGLDSTYEGRNIDAHEMHAIQEKIVEPENINSTVTIDRNSVSPVNLDSKPVYIDPNSTNLDGDVVLDQDPHIDQAQNQSVEQQQAVDYDRERIALEEERQRLLEEQRRLAEYQKRMIKMQQHSNVPRQSWWKRTFVGRLLEGTANRFVGQMAETTGNNVAGGWDTNINGGGTTVNNHYYETVEKHTTGDSLYKRGNR